MRSEIHFVDLQAVRNSNYSTDKLQLGVNEHSFGKEIRKAEVIA